MKLIAKILLVVFLSLVDIAFGQSVTWQRTYDPFHQYESGRDICQTTDDNFIVAGLSFTLSNQRVGFIVKINPFGDTLWCRIIQDDFIKALYACAPTSDGGCVVTGESDSNFVARINSDGSIRWIKYYDGRFVTNFDIRKVNSGNYILCGRNSSEGLGYITLIDSLGTKIWQTLYMSSFHIDLKSALSALDNGFIIFGTVKNALNDTSKILMLKLKPTGEIQWEKRHKIFNFPASADAADDMANGYLLGGTTIDSTMKFQGVSFFSRVDIAGNIVYSHSFYPSTQEYFYDIKRITENEFAIAVTSQQSELNAKCFLTDSLGEIMHQNIFESKNFNSFRSIFPLQNGDILFAGIYEFGPNFPQNNLYITRTDSTLNTRPLSVLQNNTSVSNSFLLFQNYPNPFNPMTLIRYSLRKRGMVSIKIFNALGEQLSTLVSEIQNTGTYQIWFDGKALSSGTYFYTLSFENENTEFKKMLLIK